MDFKQITENLRQRLTDFYSNNKKTVQIVAGSLVVIVGGSYYWYGIHMPQQESQAAEKLAKLEYYFMNDSTAMVLNGNKALKIESAPSIADSYSGTHKGSEAALMAGLTYLHTGEFQKALDYLDMADAGDAILAPQIISAQAACYSELNDYAKAASLYERAAKLGDNEFTARNYVKAAQHYTLNKDYKEALRCWETLKQDYPLSQEMGQEVQNADMYIQHLKGLLGDLN